MGWSLTWRDEGLRLGLLCQEPWFLCLRGPFPAVLATRLIWLLSTASPDHTQLWHQVLPDPKTELELGELISGEQTPGGHVRVGVGPTWPIYRSLGLFRGPGQIPNPTQIEGVPSPVSQGAGQDWKVQLCLSPDTSLSLLPVCPVAPYLFLGRSGWLLCAGPLPPW